MARSKHTPAAKGGKWLRASLRWAIYYRDSFACVYCSSVGRLSIDHRNSTETHGRDHRPKNLLTCCLSCNSKKQNLTTRAWFARLRERGIDTDVVRRRIDRSVRRQINRKVGGFLAWETLWGPSAPGPSTR